MFNVIAQFALDLFHATIIAALMFGPFFYYMLFML